MVAVFVTVLGVMMMMMVLVVLQPLRRAPLLVKIAQQRRDENVSVALTQRGEEVCVHALHRLRPGISEQSAAQHVHPTGIVQIESLDDARSSAGRNNVSVALAEHGHALYGSQPHHLALRIRRKCRQGTSVSRRRQQPALRAQLHHLKCELPHRQGAALAQPQHLPVKLLHDPGRHATVLLIHTRGDVDVQLLMPSTLSLRR
ncbi:hypothetical protein DQ04_03131000 [Trypanosoma grayi]|uniref:hypothetical protein n=1 Tax=Trypanosoma grayi TaxID=71804 RepID=UPI0004F4A249|nr:hypothetical protein DQ04_03131000 [Trypanosoma grayi]KEG10939.1 hypothetical protein DQ04_03131000 [Trypanosoma grayi]